MNVFYLYKTLQNVYKNKQLVMIKETLETNKPKMLEI